MRGNPDDLSNQLLAKIEEWLESELSDYETYKEYVGSVDSFEHGIVAGRAEYSEYLLDQIEKWKKRDRT